MLFFIAFTQPGTLSSFVNLENRENVRFFYVFLLFAQAILEDMRLVMESNKKYAETERLRIEQQMMQLIELNSSIIQTKQV